MAEYFYRCRGKCQRIFNAIKSMNESGSIETCCGVQAQRLICAPAIKTVTSPFRPSKDISFQSIKPSVEFMQQFDTIGIDTKKVKIIKN